MIRETQSGLALVDGPITCSEIAQHLERMRQAAGLCVFEGAARSGISVDLLYAWERGERLIRAQAVLSQFEAYGCLIKICPPKRTSSTDLQT